MLGWRLVICVKPFPRFAWCISLKRLSTSFFRNVYSSQDQLGGPQIMVPNGVTHQVVRDDQEGMSAILDWLSFVPKDVTCPPPMGQLANDPWDRDVEFEPSPYPYDPRDFLRGVIDYEGRRLRGFFDAGSWSEQPGQKKELEFPLLDLLGKWPFGCASFPLLCKMTPIYHSGSSEGYGGRWLY